MSYHAPLSASSLPRIALCPASYRMSIGIPNKSNPAAERGTAIHEMAENLWNGKEVITEDQEGLQWAKEYIEYIKNIKGSASIEVDLTEILKTVQPLLGGTGDAIIHNAEDNELHIVDLKTGRGVVKTDSIQLKAYALGAWVALGRPKLTVFAHIFQPHFAQQLPAQYSYDDMVQFESELKALANQAEDPFQDPTPGYEQCKYCPARVTCPSIKEKAMEVAKEEFKPTEHLADLPELLDTAEMLEGWIDAVREAAKEIMNSGGFVAGWSMAKGRKMQKIKDAQAIVELFNSNPAIFELKSLTALKKSGFDVPSELIEETISASSLKRSK
jgi:CRISPR/Cas system-associated exonuclease Cas4 (RecB family)